MPEDVDALGFTGVRRAERASGRTDYLLADGDRPWSRRHTGADELMTAVTPSNPTHERCAGTVERVVGRSAVFAAVLPLGRTGPSGLRTADDGAVEVVVGGTTHRWLPAPELRDGRAAAPWTAPPLRQEVLPSS